MKVITVEGKPVKVRRFTAKVTDLIIKTAKKCSFRLCLIAEAIQAKFKTATHIWVDAAHIKFTLGGVRYVFNTPVDLRDYVVSNDRKSGPPRNIEPFKFVVDDLDNAYEGGPGTYVKTHSDRLRNHLAHVRYNRRKKFGLEMSKRRYPKKVRINGFCRILPMAT